MPSPGVALGGASVVGSLVGGNSAKKAGKAQANAAKAASDAELEMYYQSREDMQPYQQTGNSALYQLADLYGVSRPTLMPWEIEAEQKKLDEAAKAQPAQPAPGSGPNSKPWGYVGGVGQIGGSGGHYNNPRGGQGGFGPVGKVLDQVQNAKRQSEYQVEFTDPAKARKNALSQFFTSPGYQFRREQGLDAMQNSAAARGTLSSGNTLKALQSYGDGLASQEFDSYANRLASLAGVGQTATQNVGALGANAARGSGAALQNAGAARASGYAGQANAWGSGLNQLGQLGGYMNWGGGRNMQGQPTALNNNHSWVGMS